MLDGKTDVIVLSTNLMVTFFAVLYSFVASAERN